MGATATESEKRGASRADIPGDGWAAALFASREDCAAVLRALEALAAAARRGTVADVLVNGNAELAAAVSAALAAAPAGSGPLQLRVWSLALGDKAHCWNEYVHRLWPGTGTTFFIDGYVRVRPDALQALEAALAAEPQALAAAGLPSTGRGAAALRAAMEREGGLHGNLHALRADTLHALRHMGLRLPLGVYRTDGIVGAVLSFGLDPARHDWEPRRHIALARDASWDTEPQRWWRWQDLRTQWRRLDRQAQGVLENRAVSDWLARHRRPAQALPATVERLVSLWAAEDPRALAAALAQDGRRRRAWERLQSPRDWSAARQPPALLFDGTKVAG
ncbi:hypothetical protein LOC51_41150 [Rubrivivax sp. JA1024]|nr:hypothetical protein [Rubrivivax sp. JA1024]